MTSIDLIPNDYRLKLEQRSVLRRYLALFAVVNVLVFSAGELLAGLTEDAQKKVAELRARNSITQQQQTQLEALKAQEAEYQRQWSLLRGLRAGAAVEDIFRIVDDSIVSEDLWFLAWSFRRAGIVVDGQQRGIETGYFIIVSPEGGPVPDPRFEVETHMSIKGQAKDHHALSRFVRALYQQDLISDVSVRRTSRSDFADGQVVDFDINVVLNSAVEGA